RESLEVAPACEAAQQAQRGVVHGDVVRVGEQEARRLVQAMDRGRRRQLDSCEPREQHPLPPAEPRAILAADRRERRPRAQRGHPACRPSSRPTGSARQWRPCRMLTPTTTATAWLLECAASTWLERTPKRAPSGPDDGIRRVPISAAIATPYSDPREWPRE